MKAFWHIFTLFGAMVVASGTGCDLPPIPTFGEDETPRVVPDEDAAGGGPKACEPNSRKCTGSSVRTCSADGADFEIEQCGLGETCDDGGCHPIQNTCRGGQPFALSATELAFDVSDDLKSQTRQLRISNCGTTSFVLRDVVVRGPNRPDETPVFRLETDVAQLRVAPGDVVDLKIVFRPTSGLSHVSGKLELALVLDELTNIDIALRSKALCAAASPITDFGIRRVDDVAQATGILQNCGTEPFELQGWDAPPGYEIEVTEKVPSTLDPGDEVGFSVTHTPAFAGFIEGTIHFALDDPLLSPTTKVRGLATAAECEDMLLWGHQVLVNNQPIETLPPRSGSLIRVRFPDAPADLLHWVRLVDQPEWSYARFSRATDGVTIRPRVAGTYTAEISGFDIGTGRPSCGSTEFELSVIPDEDLVVELTWIAGGDGIPEDLGFGHGANLDLHVLSTRDGDGEWNTAASDCFDGADDPCGAGDGSIRTSDSGGFPEIVAFEDIDDLQFEVGVHMSNPFNFGSANARVRVFRAGELVATLRSASLQSANDFWLVGRWDETEESWTEIDRVFSGFPK